MKSEEFIELLGGINSKMIEKASEDMINWQRSQEGERVSVDSSPRRSSFGIAAVCAVCAAVMIGVFALIINIRKNGFGNIFDPVSSPEQSGGMIVENSEQTFTKDFDGLVLTVTTDKSAYKIGEQIHLTAALENNRDEEVYLYYGMSPIDYTVELSPGFEDLIEYPHEIVSRDAAITIITVKQGEKYVQDFTFLTYTDYIESVSETGNIEYYPDYSTPAAPGVHYGKLRIGTCQGKEWNSDDITDYTLDFSVRVNGETSESENKGQTFTKDFDGLVLTVTTDKSEYHWGETVEITATLTNNRDEDIYVYYGMAPILGLSMDENEPSIEGLVKYLHGTIECVQDPVITLVPGSEYTEEHSFDMNIDVLPSAAEYSGSYSGMTASRVEKGKLFILTCPSDKECNYDEMSKYALDFSVTVKWEERKKGQSFTKDFDGLVLTVTTDKAEYNIGEPIYLTATLENNRDEDVYLYYGMAPINNAVELYPHFEDLIEYPQKWGDVVRAAVVTVIPLKPGEKCVQDFTFRTYTFYKGTTEIDYSKPAAPGVHYGTLCIWTCPDEEDHDKWTEHTLEFSVKVKGESTESENKGQTFTKDFDGLILTVTTDKAEYNIGETVLLTATLENNTGKDINLCFTDNAFELMPYFETQGGYRPKRLDDLTNDSQIFPVSFKQGEKRVREYRFMTNLNPDGLCAPGVYNGKFFVMTCSDITDTWAGVKVSELEDLFEYTLDFSVTITGHTFTKDFDGLVLTVTTNKAEYHIGEPIELIATLENKTGKDIILYYPTCGAYGYDGQKAGTAAELLPRFDKLVEYPIRSAVWIDDAVTEIPFKSGEKCVQKFTFQPYTGYTDVESATGEYKDAVIPDFSKIAAPGVYYGKFTVMFYSDAEARDDITDCTLEFSVTLNEESSDSVASEEYSTEASYTEGMLKDYFIYDRVLYTNCYTCPVDWVIDNDRYGYNFDFSKVGELVTAISGRADLQTFGNNTANILPDGTAIYKFPDNSQLLIAKSGDKYIPYMGMREG